MTNIATSMREETYLKVMRLLQENPDLTQRELAEQLGVSVGSVNYCLRALMEKGWVKMKNFVHSKNKFGYVYVLTPTGIAERTKLTSNFLARKVIEFEILKHEIEMLRVEVDNGELSDMKANKT
ncbi:MULTISPECIES: MarR family EPS-associated transcriptional regulator [unclassified Polaromonas]|uniref:MarR family EPS-associated transcriptional regulator n=1 Tax=unclassified Polaromonas TaxID=2638319 RepID=UPI0025EADEF7|nr:MULTISPECIES: MarR family EPS-associated transcriptional regulator [unclassified Polaromonas]